MLEFLIDNIFVIFDRRVFQQTIGIPNGTIDLYIFSQTLHRDFSRKTKRSSPDTSISRSAI